MSQNPNLPVTGTFSRQPRGPGSLNTSSSATGTFSREQGSYVGTNATPLVRTNRLPLLLAFLVVALTIIVTLVYAIAQKKSQQEVKTNPAAVVDVPQMPTGAITLLAPEGPVKKGTKMSEVTLREVYLRATDVPDRPVRARDQLAGMYALVDLPPGVAFSLRQLTSEATLVSLPLQIGKRAVAINIDETTGVEGHAVPGSFVDVILSYTQGSLMKTKIIIQAAKVLSLGGNSAEQQAGLDLSQPRFEGRKKALTSQGTITLELTPRDALKIQSARQLGKLTLALRPDGETTETRNTETDSRSFNRDVPVVKQQPVARRPIGKLKIDGKDYHLYADGSRQLIEAP